MGQRHLGGGVQIGDGADVDDVDRHVGPRRPRPVAEAVDIGLGVAGLDRADDPDHPGLAQVGGHRAEDVAALLGPHGVGEHIVVVERVVAGAPGERDVRVFGGDLGHQQTELGAMGDHQVVAIVGEAPHGGGRLLGWDHAIGDGDVHPPAVGHQAEGVDHALAVAQVVGRTGSHQPHPERPLRVRVLPWVLGTVAGIPRRHTVIPGRPRYRLARRSIASGAPLALGQVPSARHHPQHHDSDQPSPVPPQPLNPSFTAARLRQPLQPARPPP